MKTVYQAQVTSSGGRSGHVKSADGVIDFDTALPKEMGGKGGAPNPELLFAAGYASCFENAILHIARGHKLNPGKTSVDAKVGIGPNESGGFILAVTLDIHLPELEQAVAQKIMEEAHQVCPYSNATRGNIDVQISLVEFKNA
ncbi:MAG: organic hydroperoxide resistance protein [Pseudobdellovibrionaceae bacterium]|nr:organic hydroperoxide resistance protein [Pseudobdellovibrionaceae bacterium]